MKNCLVVHAHPNPDSFSHELRRRVESGIRRGGAAVRVRDLYAESFDPRLTLAERRSHLEPPSAKPHLQSYFEDLTWCDTIVFVHPTWWGAQPAMLKGWIDRVWVRGVAWELPEGARRLQPTLHNVRQLVTVTTHGSSRLVNALQGAPGKRIVNRSLRAICHPMCRTKWIALYRVDTADRSDREVFLERVEKMLSKLSR
ncbi:MAG: NAD(P)H-dependent oxidoreductase [Actinomycetota bacterium]